MSETAAATCDWCEEPEGPVVRVRAWIVDGAPDGGPDTMVQGWACRTCRFRLLEDGGVSPADPDDACGECVFGAVFGVGSRRHEIQTCAACMGTGCEGDGGQA